MSLFAHTDERLAELPGGTGGDLSALERLAAEGLLVSKWALAGAAQAGCIALMAWSIGKGATSFDSAMAWAARYGQTEAMAWCAGKGATLFNWAMAEAALGDHIEAMAWCAEKGATDFELAMHWAAEHGQLKAMRWCAAAGRFARGGRAFSIALVWAVNGDSSEAAELCLSWGGDINWPGMKKTAWVEAVHAGEITVEPQDPPEVFVPHDPLGGFRSCD